MMTNTRLSFSAALLVAATAFAGCSKEEPNMPRGNPSDYQQIALEFTKSLAARDYPKAYALTSQEHRKRTTVEQLRTTLKPLYRLTGARWVQFK